ncbi:hypothetical protein ETAA8_68120 [Anatilimnocola aggregata]|uniref:DUF4304 domain-containing protein n=1 Tax=Anatilimnocola aggregata TaxID=2528021 RepID=A0A517YN58_9BACT|nr:DUF4304 domain-containing protein [Anatilimnocola aggregata]QDU31652.1 hypothetical protein ETAA8_68120 [Anatilimnocola aggregata]
MKTIIETVLDEVLSDEGYRKHGKTWYAMLADVTHVIKLQRSRFGNQYYINVCVWLGPQAEGKLPKEHECHLRSRVEEFSKASLDAMLDLDNQRVTDEKRSTTLRSTLQKSVLPVLEKMGSIEAVTKLHKRKQLGAFAITAEAFPLIGSPH